VQARHSTLDNSIANSGRLGELNSCLFRKENGTCEHDRKHHVQNWNLPIASAQQPLGVTEVANANRAKMG
jgi:hypothetical protein